MLPILQVQALAKSTPPIKKHAIRTIGKLSPHEAIYFVLDGVINRDR